jgi:ADP-ribose pyrophosphatase
MSSSESSQFDEPVLDQESIYQGRIVKLYVETVRLPNGEEAQREVIRHQGAVAIVPLDEAGQVTLVRQYRLPAGQALLEVPAGTLEPNEDPVACAERELQEEVGLFPGKLERLGGIFVAPGYSSEYIHLFVATGLEPSRLKGDDDEFLEVIHMPLKEAVAKAVAGELNDGKTITALLLADHWWKKRQRRLNAARKKQNV